MRKRKVQVTKRRTHLSLQRRAATRKRKRISNRRQLSQWLVCQQKML